MSYVNRERIKHTGKIHKATTLDNLKQFKNRLVHTARSTADGINKHYI